MLLDKLNMSRDGFTTELRATKGKAIDEFSNKEWKGLLDKVDNVIEDYKEDLKQREEKALEEQKKKKERKACKDQKEMLENAWQNKHFQELNTKESSEEETSQIPEVEGSMEEYVDQNAIQKIIGNRGKTPYSIMADADGNIEYKGVIFRGDSESNSLCLGDMSDYTNVLTIPLSNGGYLKVNMDNLDSLAGAIDMFSPEDINLIMRAITKYNRLEQIKQQIEDETSGLQVMEKNNDVTFYA